MDLTTRRATDSSDVFGANEVNHNDLGINANNHVGNVNKTVRSSKSIFSIRSIMDVEEDNQSESSTIGKFIHISTRI